jgi:hypothetical protein
MKHLYIIGNGFDLDLDLKTSYSDFIQSQKFISLLNSSPANSFAKYLKNKQLNEANWMDIETELKIFINNHYDGKAEEFKKEFVSLKNCLKSYLKDEFDKFINVESLNPNSSAMHLANKIIEDLENSFEVRIVNYNYTNTVPRIVKFLNNRRNDRLDLEKIKYFHPHGEIEKEIILGTEDKSITSIKSDFHFVMKASDSNYKHIEWEDAYKNATKIFIFGHSMGESDYDSFSMMFSHLMETNTKINLDFFYLNSGYDFINNRLYKYTKGELALFKIRHIVNFHLKN